ncbi:MAG TPA: MFS transporter [Pilimelia sp.]|nr:MFS transporter [Pilimelia sp.]
MALTASERSYRRLLHAALGTALVFWVSGFVLATWVSRLPAIRDRLDASPAELGLALLAPGVGSLTSMPVTGRFCRRFGTRAVVAATGLPSCAMLVVLAVVPSLPALGAALLLFGVCYGAWDVAMNVHGSAVEQHAGRAWMPRYHACWSVGGILGAAAGAVAARADLSVPAHFTAAAAGSAVLLLVGLRLFIADAPADVVASAAEAVADPPTAGPAARPRRLFTRRLALVGLITACAILVEGAAIDWLTLYFVDVRGTTAAFGAAAYAVFSLAMAAGRFAGTPITERLGRDRVVRAGGLLSAAGVAVTLLGPGTPVALAGAVLWALGISLVYPAAMSAAGERPDRPADAIAAVAAVGYGGLLLGPPLIGVLAQHVGLGRALLVVMALAAAVAALAPATRSTSMVRR